MKRIGQPLRLRGGVVGDVGGLPRSQRRVGHAGEGEEDAEPHERREGQGDQPPEEARPVPGQGARREGGERRHDQVRPGEADQALQQDPVGERRGPRRVEQGGRVRGQQPLKGRPLEALANLVEDLQGRAPQLARFEHGPDAAAELVLVADPLDRHPGGAGEAQPGGGEQALADRPSEPAEGGLDVPARGQDASG
jgi:hypothetical protein